MEEIAAVYSRALFEVALETKKLDALREQLGQVADAFESDRNLGVFFFSPYFSTQEKKDGLGKLLVEVEPALLNFLELLVEKHRMPAIFRIRRSFDSMYKQHNKLLPVQVTTAIELDRKVLEQIGAKITEQTGRKVELSSTVDPNILGGIVLRVGNSILDASIRNRLDQLRRQVAKA